MISAVDLGHLAPHSLSKAGTAGGVVLVLGVSNLGQRLLLVLGSADFGNAESMWRLGVGSVVVMGLEQSSTSVGSR